SAEVSALALQQAGGEQLDLDAVLARPAGRAVDLAQAPLVDDAEGDDANRSASRNVGGVEHEEGRGRRRSSPATYLDSRIEASCAGTIRAHIRRRIHQDPTR